MTHYHRISCIEVKNYNAVSEKGTVKKQLKRTIKWLHTYVTFEEAGHLLHHSSSGSSVPVVQLSSYSFLHENEEEGETGWEKTFVQSLTINHQIPTDEAKITK